MTPATGRGRALFHLQVWAGLALGAAALYFAARAIDFSQLGQALRSVRLPLVAATLLTSLLTLVLKALRWRWLFHPNQPRLGLGRLSGLVAIGQAVNFIIPGRWGELVRTFLAGEETGARKWYVLGTVGAEKLIDLVILAVLVLALIPLIALPEGLAAKADTLVLAAVALTAVAIALLGGRRTWLRLARLALRLLPERMAQRWYGRIEAGLDGLTALGSRRAALAVWGLSLVFWLVAGATNLLLLLAFGLPPSPITALALLAMLQGGVAVPSTPGKIGVFQLLCMVTLAVFGVPNATGLAYGLVLHVIVVGGVTFWAALALWRRSLNLGRLARSSTSWE